jgi:hypothetical protein
MMLKRLAKITNDEALVGVVQCDARVYLRVTRDVVVGCLLDCMRSIAIATQDVYY